MEHPWLLKSAVVASSPLIWGTFQLFFPNLREDLREDGVWLSIGTVTGFWVLTWALAKLIWFVLICAVYIYVIYKVASFLFVLDQRSCLPPLEPSRDIVMEQLVVVIGPVASH